MVVRLELLTYLEQARVNRMLQISRKIYQTVGKPPLQARGRESARVRLMGRGMGMLAVRTRQAQSTLVWNIDLSDLQQSEEGEVPLPLLPVMKLKHGVKLVIIDVVHGVLICALDHEMRQLRTTKDAVVMLCFWLQLLGYAI